MERTSFSSTGATQTARPAPRPPLLSNKEETKVFSGACAAALARSWRCGIAAAVMCCFPLAYGEEEPNYTEWRNLSLGDWFVPENWRFGIPKAAPWYDPQYVYMRSGGSALLVSPSAVANYLFIGGASDELLLYGGGPLVGTLLVTRSGSAPPGSLNVDYCTVGKAGYDWTATGMLEISKGGAVTGSSLGIGKGDSADGTVIVKNPGSALTFGSLGMGDVRSNATLRVEDGAYANTGGAFIGRNSSATVTGVGSEWTQRARLEIAGNGSLLISNGGRVTTQEPVAVAEIDGLNGSSVTVTGSGSVWQNADSVAVGPSSGIVQVLSGAQIYAGNLIVRGAGRVRVENGSSAVAGLIVQRGLHTPSGTVLGEMMVGETTAGRMEVFGGGRVLNSRGYIGFNSGSLGAVFVSGAESTWSCTGSVFVGNGGQGSLEILRGGTVTSTGRGYLALAPNSNASARVSGAGSSWMMAANLFIGGGGETAGGQGVLLIENGGLVASAGTTVYHTGFLQLGPSATLDGPLTFLGGNIQTFSDISFPNNFTVGNGGVVVYTLGSTSTFSGDISGEGGLSIFFLGSPGTLTLTGNNTYTGGTNVPLGRLVVERGITSDVVVSGRGILSGSGAVGSVTVNDGGVVDPGSSPGKLTVNGNYTQTSGGTLNIEIGGSTPGAGYDQLEIAGTAALGGTLNVSLVNGYRPEVGDTFQIINSSAESGSFSTINSSGLDVDAETNGSGVMLTVTAVDPPVPLVSVGSRKVHVGAGAIDLILSQDATNPGVECRTGGANGEHTLVFTFANTLARVSGVESTGGVGAVVSSAIGTDAREYVVNLTGVANGQTISLRLTNVDDSAGNSSGVVAASMGVLLGDSNGDRAVNSGDAQQTRTRSGQPANATTFRSDFNLDGTINSGDATVVRSRSGQFIP